jgi:hypothetical protein
MSAHAQAEAIGGRIVTKLFRFFAFFLLLGGLLILIRLAAGLGQVTAGTRSRSSST